jgi:hypothetical protein
MMAETAKRYPLLPIRLRKFLGMLAMVVLVVVYSLVIMIVAVKLLPGTAWYTQMLFFAVGGILWIVPSMGLIWWMTRPDRPKADA